MGEGEGEYYADACYRVSVANMGTDCLPFFASLYRRYYLVMLGFVIRVKTYSSKCLPRFGSAFRLASTLRTLLSGRTTIIGTGEWLRQYLPETDI